MAANPEALTRFHREAQAAAAIGAEVEVEPGEVATVELDPRPLAELDAAQSGRLELDVDHDEAEVLIDGRPLTAGPIPAGPHLVEIRASGFVPWSPTSRPSYVRPRPMSTATKRGPGDGGRRPGPPWPPASRFWAPAWR